MWRPRIFHDAGVNQKGDDRVSPRRRCDLYPLGPGEPAVGVEQPCRTAAKPGDRSAARTFREAGAARSEVREVGLPPQVRPGIRENEQDLDVVEVLYGEPPSDFLTSPAARSGGQFREARPAAELVGVEQECPPQQFPDGIGTEVARGLSQRIEKGVVRRPVPVGGELIEENRREVEDLSGQAALCERVCEREVLAGGVQQDPRRVDPSVGSAVLGLVQVPEERQLGHRWVKCSSRSSAPPRGTCGSTSGPTRPCPPRRGGGAWAPLDPGAGGPSRR